MQGKQKMGAWTSAFMIGFTNRTQGKPDSQSTLCIFRLLKPIRFVGKETLSKLFFAPSGWDSNSQRCNLYNVSRPSGYGPWCLEDVIAVSTLRITWLFWPESTLFFASLWYFPRLVKPDRAFPYQKFHIGNQPTSHHIGHTIWWWARTCSQNRTWTCMNTRPLN